MVVSPAICGTIISRYGTEEQKQRWLPGICDGTSTMAFAITEPDAGTNTHNITTSARRDGDEWVLNGRKIYISGVDEADNVLVVARAEDAKTGKVKPVLFVVPTDSPGFEFKSIPMEIVSPELQFTVFIDDVRLPDDDLGDEDGGLVQLFAGLNPERIMAASFSTGLARFALDRAAAYAKERVVFKDAIGSHQAIAHPLAQTHIEVELARLMTRRPPRSTTPATTWAQARPPTWRSTPPPRPPATPRTVRCRPMVATGSPRSTAWPASWSPPAPAGSRRSAGR